MEARQMKKPTFAQQVLSLLAAHGPLTKKQLLTHTGHKLTSMGSYFATVETVGGWSAHAAGKRRQASLVARGVIVKVGKAGAEVLYGLPQA
jgi:hypothetical protein